MMYLFSVLMIGFMLLVSTPIFAQTSSTTTMKTADKSNVPSPGTPHFEKRPANDPIVHPKGYVEPNPQKRGVNPTGDKDVNRGFWQNENKKR
jgi:hypothetical protein